MAPNDDIDAECVPYPTVNTTIKEACNYVLENSDACEGGGYILWTEIVVCETNSAWEIVLMIASALWLMQLFMLLAVSADGYLSNNVATIAERFGISENVAGVTLVAFANGAPDIFSAIASAVSDSSPKAGLAFGELLGGGMFDTAIVAPSVIMVRQFRLDAFSTVRNLGFYVVAMGWLAVTLFATLELQMWQPLGFLAIYFIYAFTVASRQMMDNLLKWRETKNKASSTIFVRPKTRSQRPLVVETISEGIGKVERSNSILPSDSNIKPDLSKMSPKEDDPCQDLTVRGILRDLIDHIITFDREELKHSSIWWKIFMLSKTPCDFFLRLTVPLALLSWCKALAMIQCFTAPITLIVAFQLQGLVIIPGGPPIFVYILIISSIIAFILGILTSVDEEPRYYRGIACIAGFVVSIGWVYEVAAEVVDVVQMLGVVSTLSPEILGVTVVGWTNSIGDLVADTALARQGLGNMALAAAFGGPMFSELTPDVNLIPDLLVGFGLAFTIALLQGKTVEIGTDEQKIIMYAFMCISVCSSLILLILQKFYVRKAYAIFLYCVYGSFMLMLVLTESGLVNF